LGAYREQVPFALQVFLLKIPPHLVPTFLAFPFWHTSCRLVFDVTHLERVVHLFIWPQVEPTAAEVQTLVQQTVFGLLVP